MKRNLAILILCLLLGGCSQPEYEDAFVHPEYIQRDEMGLIITKIQVPYKNVLSQPCLYNGYMVLRNVNTNVKYKINGASYDDSASMIQPGIYQIDKLGWDDGAYNYSYNVHDPELHTINLLFGAFEIKPGECLYLGDILVNKKSVKTEFPLNISDHNAQMQCSLKADSLQGLRSKIKFCNLLTDSNSIKKNSNGQYCVDEGQKND